jgi:anti-sigma factor RsiW
MNIDREECRRLITGLIDNELTPEERIAANECLRRSEECRREFEQLLESSSKLQLLSLREPEDRALNRLWRAPHHWLLWRMGTILVLAATGLLLGFTGYEFVKELMEPSDEPLLPRIAVAGLVAGGLLIFSALVLERIRTYKTDRYKEIER